MEPTRPWTLSVRANRWFDVLLVLALLGVVGLFVWSGFGPAELMLCVLQIAPLWWGVSRLSPSLSPSSLPQCWSRR